MINSISANLKGFRPCSYKRSEAHIDAIVRLQPIPDAANASQDETIILKAADACEVAGLHQLAQVYRQRAGEKQPTEQELKRTLYARAIQIITEHQITPVELQHALGLNRHDYLSIVSLLKKSGKIEFLHKQFYSIKQEKMF